MTAPLTGRRYEYEPGSLGAATLRPAWRPSRSLAVGWLRRGTRRQWLLALLAALFIAGIGIAYDLTGGVRWTVAALFWVPIGLASGLALGALREFGRNTVTSISSLGKHRGYSVLGAAPVLTKQALRQLPPDKRTPLGCLAFDAASPFATAFRDLQSTIQNKCLVAFVASLPEEGATTAALCTAVSATQQGRSVIVVDCDLRRRALSRALDCETELGALEACERPENWRHFVEEEAETGLRFIPAAQTRNPWRSLIGEPGFALLIALLREHYDVVILDCPPALTSAEGAVLAGLADQTVVVTAWDRTPLNAVRRTIHNLRRRTRGVAGVYVNRVPPGYRFGRLRPD